MVEIIRKINLEGIMITARHDTESGEFAFGAGEGLILDYQTQVGINPFKIINQLAKTYQDINPKRIVFQAVGLTKKSAEKRDRFYSRVLTRKGYIQVQEQPAFLNLKFKQNILSGSWSGPTRVYSRDNLL